MSAKASAKKYRVVKKNAVFLPYNMGHILYMAQLAGSIEKKNIIASMPKQERDRYKMAFETLVKDGILIRDEKQKKKDSFSINPTQTANAKELILSFIKGVREEKREKEIKRNPFFHRGPIKDTVHFIGRQEVVSHIFDRLRHTEDCSIIGPRAIGKTSLLHYISNDEVLKKYRLDPGKYIFVYYDLERLGKDAEVKDFYYEMFSRTVSQINLSDAISDEEIKTINEEAGNVIKKINISLFDLGDLEAIIGALSERDYNVVYMFDEFDYLANNPIFDFSFYGQLRALSGNPDFKIAFVTASKRSIYELTFTEEIKTSPFFRYFEDFSLGPMDKGEIKGFYDIADENGVVFSSQIRNIIEEWSGGHPFLIQLACDYFFDLVLKGNLKESIDEDKHLATFLKKHKKHFAYFWKQLEKEEQECLWRLASNKALGSDCEEIIKNLEESYLVESENDEYRIFSKAFERFVRDSSPLKSE